MSRDALAHFANFKLAGDRLVRDAVFSIRLLKHESPSSGSRKYFFGSSNVARSANGSSRLAISGNRAARGGRRRRRVEGARVGAMSDADLEAELAARRAARARERNRYARAMRTEKLAALEEELNRLRGEISKIDPAITRRAVGMSDNRAQQHAHVTWDKLPGEHVGSSRRTSGDENGRSGSIPPPPPPPRGPPLSPGDSGTEGFDLVIDPEKQKREKEERQRRREEKRKQREAAKKPMTLADIIRSAGPDPMKRLKPVSAKVIESDVAGAESSFEESIKTLKSALKSSTDGIAGTDNEVENSVDGAVREALATKPGSESDPGSTAGPLAPSKDDIGDSLNKSPTDKENFIMEDSACAPTNGKAEKDIKFDTRNVKSDIFVENQTTEKLLSGLKKETSTNTQVETPTTSGQDEVDITSLGIADGKSDGTEALQNSPLPQVGNGSKPGEAMPFKSSDAAASAFDNLANLSTSAFSGESVNQDDTGPKDNNSETPQYIKTSERTNGEHNAELNGVPPSLDFKISQRDVRGHKGDGELPNKTALSSLSKLVATMPSTSQRVLSGETSLNGSADGRTLSASNSNSAKSPTKLTLAEKRQLRRTASRNRSSRESAQSENPGESAADSLNAHKID